MLKTGDKIKYVKENPMIGIPLNTVFTVTNIDGTVIALEGEINLCGLIPMCSAKCIMSYDEYEKYFEKVVEEPKPTWTKWRTVGDAELWNIMNCLDENHYVVKYLKHYLRDASWYMYTRNNGKKTDVELRIGVGSSFKSTSTCNKHFDKFDEKKGIQVALIKMFPKIIAHFAKCYITNTY
jgi:hypothetical protein